MFKKHLLGNKYIEHSNILISPFRAVITHHLLSFFFAYSVYMQNAKILVQVNVKSLNYCTNSTTLKTHKNC